MKLKALCLTFLLFLSACSVISLKEENDIFGILTENHDMMYSQGLEIKYFGNKEEAPELLQKVTDYIPSLSLDNGLIANKYTLDVGQHMYTPHNKRSYEPVYDQNPYVGLLYTKVGKEEVKPDERKWANLLIGTTGPNSLAGQTQRLVHKILDCQRPNGWEYQVDNEIVFMHQSGLEDRDLLIQYKSGKFEQTSGYNLNLGTWNTSGELFIAHHFGQNYELFSSAQNSSWSWRIYNKPYFRAVVRDMTLDGNTFHESKVTVDSKPFVYGNRLGIILEYRGYALEFGTTTQSKLFNEQDKPWHTFGGFQFTKLFDY